MLDTKLPEKAPDVRALVEMREEFWAGLKVGVVSDSVKEADKVSDEMPDGMSKEVLKPRDSVKNVVEVDNDAV